MKNLVDELLCLSEDSRYFVWVTTLEKVHAVVKEDMEYVQVGWVKEIEDMTGECRARMSGVNQG